MKVLPLTLLSIAVAVLSAPVPQKAVIVTYPENTPSSVIDDAMAAILAAGGLITHEYNFIKGFAAKAPAKVLKSVQALGVAYNINVEEDQVVEVV